VDGCRFPNTEKQVLDRTAGKETIIESVTAGIDDIRRPEIYKQEKPIYIRE